MIIYIFIYKNNDTILSLTKFRRDCDCCSSHRRFRANNRVGVTVGGGIAGSVGGGIGGGVGGVGDGIGRRVDCR